MKIRKFCLGILVLLSLTPAWADLTTGLVAYYPFDGNANDYSGNGNDLTVNGAVLAAGRFGGYDKCYSFSNSTITGAVANCPLGNSPRTLSVWIKTADPDYTFTAGNVVTWGLDQTMGRFGLCVHGGNAYFVGGYADLQGTNFVADDQWHQIVVTYADNVLTLYVDGRYDRSAALGLDTVGNQLVLGDGTPAKSRHTYYRGLADDVRIYNRALTSREVGQLYSLNQPHSGPHYLIDSLVAYYPFDGNADDYSGNGNDLTVHGAMLAAGRFGGYDQCYSFSNSTITGPVNHCPLGDSPRTLSVWIKTADPDYAFAAGNVVTWGLDRSQERFGLCVHGGNAYFVGDFADLQGTNFVADDEWHQLVVTYSTNAVLTLYVDGQYDRSAVLNLDTVGNQLVLGDGTPAKSRHTYYRGLADDVRIYSRAFSSREVSQLFHMERPPQANPRARELAPGASASRLSARARAIDHHFRTNAEK